MARSGRTSRHGFTLVEMLVVLAIIGLLAAILVPTIGIAMRTVRQGAIRVEMKNMETAIESYKNKYQTYPIDFTLPLLIFPHVKQISRRAAGTEALYAQWRIEDLPNPHYRNGMPAAYQTRNPQTMLQHEAMVFLLSELSTNAEYPFGYRYDGTNWLLVDYTWNAGSGQFVLTGTKENFFEFKPGQLADLDQDGWLEYLPANLDVPYVYFDGRTYRPGTAPVGLDFENNTLNITGVTGGGHAQPYWKDTTNSINASSFQLLACGMDGTFGVSANPGDATLHRYYPSGTNFSTQDRDNLANFAESRLDEELTE